MSHIAVIGAGTMGNGIAHVFAQFGFQVTLIDRSAELLDRGMATIRRNMDRQVEKQVITALQRDEAIARIRTATEMTTIRDCFIAVEAATENKAVKLEIFRQLDRETGPDTILASNTSSISITEIAAATGRPSRVIGMHFMNPV
ncbi:MAG: 3-hydroxyacyl-CoA dehydrogenase family protein, partial [Bacteroidota bacterium]